ncbi:MAG: chemotaxis protein MotB [Oleiphilaceae bacterium]|jgi:chemotaxis protein MotB
MMNSSNRPSLNLQLLASDIESHNDDSWMISYIDVFVLMSTVFVMLLVLSRTDIAERVSLPPINKANASVEQIVDVSDLALGISNTLSPVQNINWLEDISTSIKENGLGGLVTLIKDSNFTELAIQSRVLFSSGTSELTRSGEDVLEKLVPVLKDSDGLVFIEGHTDDRPISTSRFSSNWDLASARATEVLQFFVAEGIKKSRFRAVSYGDTKPLVENTTEANRQRNRRVSLMIQQQVQKLN